jgi:hypothetical protein
MRHFTWTYPPMRHADIELAPHETPPWTSARAAAA